MWLDRPAPTPTQPDATPTNNKENTPARQSSDKRRRLATDLEGDSTSESNIKPKTRLSPPNHCWPHIIAWPPSFVPCRVFVLASVPLSCVGGLYQVGTRTPRTCAVSDTDE